MAEYYGFTLTNYFAVKDEDRFKTALGRCAVCEDKINIFERTVDGHKFFAFGCYSSLLGFPVSDSEDDTEYDLDEFYNDLQTVVADGDAIIITEVGHEKLRYLVGVCMIITQSGHSVVNLNDISLGKARELLKDNTYSAVY